MIASFMLAPFRITSFLLPHIARNPARMAAALAGCAALSLCGCHKQPAPVADQSSSPSMIETVAVHSQTVTDSLVIPARVAPDPTQVVHVYSQLSGRLLELYVRPGQIVKKGQSIGVIQSSDISQARSDYQKAKIEAARADLQLNRAKQLLDHQVIAARDYDDLAAADQAAHAETERAAERITMLGFSLEGNSDTAPLKAPISGVVLDIGSSSGEFEKSLDNANSIATIANLDHVWVLGDVFERDAAAVSSGKAVDISFSAYPGEGVKGRISNVSDAIDPTSMTLKARVVLPNLGLKYKPLMYASLTVIRGTQQAFVVPQTAVLRVNGKTLVFVKNNQGSFEQRTVTAGPVNGDTVPVTDGLHDGDTVVVAGASLLRTQGSN